MLLYLILILLFYFFYFCFVFNDTATTEIYTYGHTLSLHDALSIAKPPSLLNQVRAGMRRLGMAVRSCAALAQRWTPRNAGTNPVTPISTVRAQFARYALKRNGGSTTACSELDRKSVV